MGTMDRLLQKVAETEKAMDHTKQRALRRVLVQWEEQAMGDMLGILMRAIPHWYGGMARQRWIDASGMRGSIDEQVDEVRRTMERQLQEVRRTAAKWEKRA